MQFSSQDSKIKSQATTLSMFSMEASTAPADTPVQNRWWAIPPANAVHLAIGSVYCYSMWTPGMTQALGVVSSCSLDWTQAEVVPVWSASAVVLGITTAALGGWVESVGPRKAAQVGSALWSSALLTTAAGVEWHSLPLVYMGWGVLDGMGWGLLYLSPVTAVMKWFPDRRGLATGLALSAFGAGAAIAPVLIQGCIDFYAVAPEYIGSLQAILPDVTTAVGGTHHKSYVTLTTLEDGTQVVAETSKLGTPGTPVVVATELDVAKHSLSLPGSGAYVLGTGNSGTSKPLATLGIGFGSLGVLGARFMKVPHPGWTPKKLNGKEASPVSQSFPTQNESSSVGAENYGLPVDYSTRTYQFPLLWLSVFGNATAGLALVSSSKVLLTDLWANLAPTLVTPAFATAYVSALGFGMAVGRFGWSATSDFLGRRNMYPMFGVVSLPIVALCPTLTHYAILMSSLAAGEVNASAALLTPLVGIFCGGSVLAITFYGGVLSVLPAYIADLFGPKHSGALHGKLLTAWAASAVVGPLGLTFLRQKAANKSTMDLLEQVRNEAAFEQAFGCSLHDTSTIGTLIEAKTVTIARLMEVVPVGTVDPTPYLYDTTCYAAAALIGVSLIANWMIHPIDVRGVQKKIDNDKDDIEK